VARAVAGQGVSKCPGSVRVVCLFQPGWKAQATVCTVHSPEGALAMTRSINLPLARRIVACLAYYASTSQLCRDLEATAPTQRRRAALVWFATLHPPA
jgi:hypothetical protein